MGSDIINVDTVDIYELGRNFNIALNNVANIKSNYASIEVPKEINIGNHLNDMDTITKTIKEKMTSYLNELKQIIMNAVSQYRLIDGEVTDEAFMQWVNSIPEDYETYAIVNEILRKFKDANLINGNIDINKLQEEMYDYIESNADHKNTLEFWKNHIPDNFTEFINNYNWDSPANLAYKKNGFTSFTEWFQVSGVDFRMTRMVDLNSDYANLMSLMNLTYCCEMINTIGTWDKDVMDILSKRKYIDIFVPDFPNDVGAAYYCGDYEGLDYIALPTRMGSKHMYDNEGSYSYLRNCVPHEMGHYMDDICGVTHGNGLGTPSAVYNLAEYLLNNYMYQIQLINNSGNVSDEESLKRYRVGEDDNSFSEGFAELMRANLVNHDAFVQLIGLENYNALFNGMQAMDPISDYEVLVTVDDNKNVFLEMNSNRERKYYYNGLCQTTRELIENGQWVNKIFFYDNNNDLLHVETKGANNKLLAQTIYYRDNDGNPLFVETKDTFGNVVENWRYYWDDTGRLNSNVYTDKDNNTKTSIFDENGREKQIIVRDAAGNFSEQWEFFRYDNGSEKTVVYTHFDNSVDIISYDINGFKTGVIKKDSAGNLIEQNN